jgi:peptidoglycan/xylan/chitin deacetylase (PgdA/CDA1 family)
MTARTQDAAVGETRIATWHDDRKAVFLLMFDDSWPSHFQVAVPELVKRQMVGTFYINPGKGEYKGKGRIGHWEGEDAAWKQGMAYGNHTMTHKGVKDMADAEREIGGCTDYIMGIVPGKKPRLISWAKPGVGKGKWNIDKEQLDALLAKHHLVARPPFRDHGAVYHMKEAKPMLALADKAIAAGGMEYLIIHGVERRKIKWSYQDFWPLNQDVFREVLDGLAERRARGDLWITDHVSYHKYETERGTAKVAVVKAGADAIELRLTCDADPQLYDAPLTLLTRVPKEWRRCRVTQNGQTTAIEIRDGIARFDAIPGDHPIRLEP